MESPQSFTIRIKIFVSETPYVWRIVKLLAIALVLICGMYGAYNFLSTLNQQNPSTESNNNESINISNTTENNNTDFIWNPV